MRTNLSAFAKKVMFYDPQLVGNILATGCRTDTKFSQNMVFKSITSETHYVIEFTTPFPSLPSA
jgi:hypothetical protein